MPNNLVQYILHTQSGLPEDQIVNTFSITTSANTEVIAEEVESALETMYHVFDAYMSADLTGAVSSKWYNRADAPPRVPWFEGGTVITPGAGTPGPAEVALCISFAAAPLSGSPPARRRGRIYIGPFQGDNNNGVDFGRPDTSLVTALKNGANGFLAASLASGDWSWAVWSGVDSAAREVLHGWVDNAWDTQRRRGIKPSSRQTFDGS